MKQPVNKTYCPDEPSELTVLLERRSSVLHQLAQSPVHKALDKWVDLKIKVMNLEKSLGQALAASQLAKEEVNLQRRLHPEYVQIDRDLEAIQILLSAHVGISRAS